MNRMISSHLKSFADNYNLTNESLPNQFEHFVNYSIVKPLQSVGFDPPDLKTSENDDGIDGIASIINEEIILDPEDAESIFNGKRKNNDVHLIFCQAKTSEKFDLGDFLKFKEAILRFVENDHYTDKDEKLIAAKNIFEKALDSAPNLRDSNIGLTIRFVTLGLYQKPKEIENARLDLIEKLQHTGYFNDPDVKIFGRNELMKLWKETSSSISAKLYMHSYANLPVINGVEEAYLVVAKAKDVVSQLLTNDDGNLRQQVFEENVRSYLGSKNPVNENILQTLKSKETASRFPVLNNGITIVSPDVMTKGDYIHLKNFQIVNGCQTSNALYQCRKELTEETMVSIKVVETVNEDVFTEIVKATNKQSKVDDRQFFSLKPICKRIEMHFDSYKGENYRIFFERRQNQFMGDEDVKQFRIFNLDDAMKSVVSMFLLRPDLAYRYRQQMYNQFGDDVFDENNDENIFYAACLTLYRLHLFVSNKTIPQNSRKHKWHILAAVRILVAGPEKMVLNSKKAKKSAQKIIETMSQKKAPGDIFKRAVESINLIPNIPRDHLKKQSLLNQILQELAP